MARLAEAWQVWPAAQAQLSWGQQARVASRPRLAACQARTGTHHSQQQPYTLILAPVPVVSLPPSLLFLNQTPKPRQTSFHPPPQERAQELYAQAAPYLKDLLVQAQAAVQRVDDELRPFLKQQLGKVPALQPYAADPVTIQALVYAVVALPAVALLVLLLLALTAVG